MQTIRKTFRYVALVFVTTFLGGCTVGPDYHPPVAEVCSAWAGTGTDANEPGAIAGWWTNFSDPVLTGLIDEAMVANLDLRQARSRLVQARAARAAAAGGLWPAAGISGSATRSRPAGAGATAGSLFQTGLDATWELDIFGGTRRAIESAEADVQAAVEDERDVMVSLAAEIGLNYIQVRSFQQQIEVTKKNLEAQRHSARLTRQRYDAGLASALDVANSEALTASTSSQLPLLESSLQQAIYGLSILLGREPGALVERLSATGDIPAAPPYVPAGLPSDLLRRRPDIRRAEAHLHSATAQIGVAAADLFPRFSLTGTGGYQSDRLSSLIRSANRSWSLRGAVDWQIFSAGRVQANVELQKAVAEQALLAYQKTVLSALQDVENALVAYSREQERRKDLLEAVAANQRAVELTTQLYTEGLTDFISVIDAERSLHSSENALVQSTANLSANVVALYKALGGGWQE